jgi:hypothetical protein
MTSSTSSALAAAIPTAERALALLRTTSYQELRRLPGEAAVQAVFAGRRVTLTTYVDVLTQHDREVQVAVRLVAHGWLGFCSTWAQGFRATSSGVRRDLRKDELYEYG